MRHPLDLHDLMAIEKLKKLNSNCLFLNLNDANDFLDYYNSTNGVKKAILKFMPLIWV